METKLVRFFQFCLLGAMSLSLVACVVAPSQPMGYRMTSTMLPTYVNGQYIGMQPNGYALPPSAAQTQTQAQSAAPTPTSNQQPVVVQQQAPVYIQSPTPSVVYIQAPTPVYAYGGYNPYYYQPAYIDPWYGLGLGVGLGIGINYYGSWGRRGGWHGGGWHH